MSDTFDSQDPTVQAIFNEMFNFLSNIGKITFAQGRDPALYPINDAIENVAPTLYAYTANRPANDLLNALRDSNNKLGS